MEVEFISAMDQLSIWKYAVAEAQRQAATSAAMTAAVTVPVSVTAASHIKLPRLSIPQFSGKVTEWVPFRDSFTALVKSNRSLSDVEKLHYLKGCAQGEASEIICNVQLANGNFDTAWTLLQTRYENKRVVVNAHLAEILKLETIKRESAASLLNMRNIVKRNLAALKNFQCPTEHYGAILIHVLTEKLDQQTQRDWELSIASMTDIPQFDDFDTFLLERIRVLDSISPAEMLKKSSQPFNQTKSNVQSQPKSSDSKFKPLAIKSYIVTQPSGSCPICNQEHKIYQCAKFKEILVTERFDYVRSLHLCSNCLSKGHKHSVCPSTGTCRQSTQKHHTLLHRDPLQERNPTNNAAHQPASAGQTSVQTHLSTQSSPQSTKILLATARVWISSNNNHKVQIRALLDQGSTWSFVSSRSAMTLGDRRIQTAASMIGLGGVPAGTSSTAITVNLFDQNQQAVCQTQALVLPKITSYTTDNSVPITNFAHLKNLSLADDLSNNTEIDLLIGADLYGCILLDEIRKGRSNEPVAQHTVFGWVIFGPCLSAWQATSSMIPVHHCMPASKLDTVLNKFWEIESIPSKTIMSPEEQCCESHFSDTHSRDADGRYMVCIPFDPDIPRQLGQSRSIAENVLKRVETRLARHPEQQLLYLEFMEEYQTLNHMSPVNPLPSNHTPIVYIPHHPIIREQSQTTKLRVVFNASSKTSTGVSLNDCMLTGPKLQCDLFVILSQWRSYPLVFVADIVKMYRQIVVDPRDRDYQCILWRPSIDCKPIDYQLNTVTYGTRSAPYLALRVIKQLIADEGVTFPLVSTVLNHYQCILWRPSIDCKPIDYQLNTVTYGTRSAPYLALRVIKQLIADEGVTFPLVSTVLNHDTFVDDLLFGAYDTKAALKVHNEVIALLGKAQLQPRKWASNRQELVSDIDPTNHGLSWNSLSRENSGVKVLGLKWHPSTDTFSFSINIDLPSSLSKRQVLSLLSQLFDPLDWVAPVIIKGKILMQRLWLNKIPWDEALQDSLATQWLEYFESLTVLSEIQIPRWNYLHTTNQSSQLHGFSDASNDAYGAVVYLRTVDNVGNVQISLIISKTKVAPLKPVSVHRLELQAALLLAQLVVALRDVRAFADLPVQCWTDSSITLAWLKKHASAWKLFVCNRVAEIQELLPNRHWRHVPTSSNPADLASRGYTPAELVNRSLWWRGPDWLLEEPAGWPNTFPETPPEDMLEANIIVSHVTNDADAPLYIVVHKFSSWLRALRVTAYLLRYKKNLNLKIKQRKQKTAVEAPVCLGPLSAHELSDAQILLFKHLQTQMFAPELHTLTTGESVSTKSKLSSLYPYIDEATGVMRVGGRLTHSLLSHDAHHPVILQSPASYRSHSTRSSALFAWGNEAYLKHPQAECVAGQSTPPN